MSAASECSRQTGVRLFCHFTSLFLFSLLSFLIASGSWSSLCTQQALEGGGAKNINFQELAADLAQITFDYPFRIPPYFALIIRAIGVLEGIALVREGGST